MSEDRSRLYRVSVCICTFRRPLLLEVLIRAVANQFMGDLIEELQIVVVDNDPDNSAREVLASWHDKQRVSLIAIHLPVANIALARNAAISAASLPWIAFIDDDENPEEDWLYQLARCQQQFSADAVFAPVVPRYLPGTPDWLIQGRFFDRRRFVSGSRIDEEDARTGNVFLSAEMLLLVPGPFDSTFGRTGGEDSLLFRQLLAQNKIFIWCDEAPVEEDVPVDRANARWLLARSYRIGQTWIRAELYSCSRITRISRGTYLCGRAFVFLLLAIGLTILYAPWSKIRAFQWLRTAYSQMGKLTGLTRFQYREYGA